MNVEVDRPPKSQLIPGTVVLPLHTPDQSQSKVQPRFKRRKTSLHHLMGDWHAQFFGEIVSDHLWKQYTIITFHDR